MATRGQLSVKEANELSINGSKRNVYGKVIPKVKIHKMNRKNYRYERNR